MMRRGVGTGPTMQGVVCAGLMMVLASALAQAEPAMRAPDQPLPTSNRWSGDRVRDTFWFFGDGGFHHPRWQREGQPPASDDWFFGDGGFGCPVWWCKRWPGQR
jgi:hypothetical protein